MTLPKGELGELWLLLFKEPSELTDREADRLLGYKEILAKLLCDISQSFPHSIEAVKRYWTRKRELSLRATDELQALADSLLWERAHFLDEFEMDEDDLKDFFFHPPPIDSDEHIIAEILKERQEKEETSARPPEQLLRKG